MFQFLTVNHIDTGYRLFLVLIITKSFQRTIKILNTLLTTTAKEKGLLEDGLKFN